MLLVRPSSYPCRTPSACKLYHAIRCRAKDESCDPLSLGLGELTELDWGRGGRAPVGGEVMGG
jgi:hypothetical protein